MEIRSRDAVNYFIRESRNSNSQTILLQSIIPPIYITENEIYPVIESLYLKLFVVTVFINEDKESTLYFAVRVNTDWRDYKKLMNRFMLEVTNNYGYGQSSDEEEYIIKIKVNDITGGDTFELIQNEEPILIKNKCSRNYGYDNFAMELGQRLWEIKPERMKITNLWGAGMFFLQIDVFYDFE